MTEQPKQLPSASVRFWLKSVLDSWVSEKLLSETAASELRIRYDLDAIEPSRSLRVLFIIGVISLVGAIMLGMGVILFFAANWQNVTPMQKVMLIFAGIVATYVVGYECRFGSWNLPILGEAVILAGAMFYGAGIWLIAQIFNIEEHYPNGVLLWGLGILPLAALLPSLVLTVLASLLFLLYFGLQCYEVQTVNFVYLGLVVIMLWAGYRFKSRLLVFINYMGLAGWFIVSFNISEFIGAGGRSETLGPTLCLIVLAGVAALMLGRMHFASEPERILSDPYLVTGFFAVFLPLYAMSFGIFVQGVRSELREPNALIIFVSGVGLFLVMTGHAIWVLMRREQAEARGAFPYTVVAEAALLVGVAVLALVFMVLMASGEKFTPLLGGLIALLFNLVLGLFLIGLIVIGSLKEINVLAGLGMLGVVVLLATRYFDMFWNLMSRSQFFIIGGALLLLVAWIMERFRRGIRSMTKEISHA